jgi:hypothetical protein
MTQICEVVKQVIENGCLTIEAEEQLRQLLAINYDLEDIEALTKLQRAAIAGFVKQESRQLMSKAKKLA